MHDTSYPCMARPNATARQPSAAAYAARKLLQFYYKRSYEWNCRRSGVDTSRDGRASLVEARSSAPFSSRSLHTGSSCLSTTTSQHTWALMNTWIRTGTTKARIDKGSSLTCQPAMLLAACVMGERSISSAQLVDRSACVVQGQTAKQLHSAALVFESMSEY